MNVIASDRANTPIVPMYRALVGLGVVCALLIVAVFIVTAPLIATNERVHRQAAVYEVLPGTVETQAFAFLHGQWQPADDGSPGTIYAGYGAGGELTGVAIEAQGMGYQDTIQLLYGYDPQAQRIVGMTVLRSRETPGLGDRIQSHAPFRANFAALDVTLGADGHSLRHGIAFVREGAKRHPWEVDGITGATISSQAVARILQESAQHYLPRIRSQRTQLARPGP